MLKFLTHKLRTHSINEDNYIEKVNHTVGVIAVELMKVIYTLKNGCLYLYEKQRTHHFISIFLNTTSDVPP